MSDKNGSSAPGKPDLAALRAEIAQTRTELGETVQALAAKADVKALAKEQVEETKAWVRAQAAEATGKVREAAQLATGKVRGAAAQATDKARHTPGRPPGRSRNPEHSTGPGTPVGRCVRTRSRSRRCWPDWPPWWA